MKTYKNTATGRIHQYEDSDDIKALQDSGVMPVTLEPHTPPAPTQEELDAQALAAKWTEVATFWAALTVTINGNKYKADEAGSTRMSLKRDAIATDATTMWYEDWGVFSTNKVDLQEAITQAEAELQAFIDATMAGK